MFNVDDKITFKIKVNNEIVSFTGRVSKNKRSHKYYLFFNSNHRKICAILKSSIPTFFDIAETYNADTDADTVFPEFDTLEHLELFIKAISIEALKELNEELRQIKITKTITKLDYKGKKPLSPEVQSQKEVEFAVENAKLQLSSDILATKHAIAEQETVLSEIKTTYPLNTQDYVNHSSELASLKEDLTILESLFKELGF